MILQDGGGVVKLGEEETGPPLNPGQDDFSQGCHRNMAGPLLGMAGDIPSLVRGLNNHAWEALAPGSIYLLFWLKLYALIYARLCPLLSGADPHPQTFTKPPVPIMNQLQRGLQTGT